MWELAISIIIVIGIWLFYRTSMDLKINNKVHALISLFLFLTSFWFFTAGIGFAFGLVEYYSITGVIRTILYAILKISIWVNFALTIYFIGYYIIKIWENELKKIL